MLLVAGCRTSPIYNVTDTPIAAAPSQPTLEEIKNAIIRAGMGLGWQMRPIEPGHIVGTLYLRTHMAQVDVTYDQDSYSIVYRDSSNLNYDGTRIHSNYNGWIQNLDNAIKTQIVNL
jgi:hypothetical protein